MKHRFYCSYKKIIFYNTSINALLKHEEKMLAEMQDKRHFIKKPKKRNMQYWIQENKLYITFIL